MRGSLFSRLNALFLTQKKRVIPYVLYGEGSDSYTLALMHAMVTSGADAIELGIPFTDPIADGPVLARAHARACAKRATIAGLLAMVARFRTTNRHTPIIVMTYYNPVFQFGTSVFCKKAAMVGIDGLLIVDAPHAGPERRALIALCHTHSLAFIPLICLNATPEALAERSATGSGYLYLVALDGVTGSGDLKTAMLKKSMRRALAHTTLPIAVGFGITTVEKAKAVYSIADTIIIGSHLCRLQEHANTGAEAITKIGNFIRRIKIL